MNTYSRALRHINMKDVKKKHQQKLIEQKIQRRLEREEKKYIQSVMEDKKYDWRKKLNEGMTSTGTFFTTLPATGEVDLQAISGANQSSFDPTYTTGIEFGSSGDGSGRMGGFNIGQNYVKFSQTPDAYGDRTVDTIKVDTSEYTTITVNAIAGNNSNGGVSPTANLFVYWFSDTNAGLLGTIPSSGSSLTQYSFNLPTEARGKNIDIYFVEPDVPLQRTQYIGQSIPSLHPSTWNDTIAGYANNILMKANPTSDDFDYWGGAAWIAMQQQYYGGSGFTWNYPGYPAPVSGSTTGTTGADRIAVGQAIYNAFGNGSSTRYPLTYGIKGIGYQRRTPVNVFISLDRPEATAFIRTEPNLSNLSPKEKQQKLREMLLASDEYVTKMLGPDFPGTGAVPPGQGGDIPGLEITNYQPPISTKQQSIIDKSLSYSSPVIDVEMERFASRIPSSFDQTRKNNLAKGHYDSAIMQINNLTNGKYPVDSETLTNLTLSIRRYEVLSGKKFDGSNIDGSKNKNPTPTTPTQPKPQLDKYGRQVGTPLPAGVQQDIQKGGKTASPVGNAAIMAAAAALVRGGFKGGASSAETGSQLPARGSAEWQRMSKEYTRANPGQYNPFMTNAQNQLMQKYGVGSNAIPLRSLRNSYEPQGEVISERRKLKSPEEVLNKIPGYYDGKPAPLGFPETPPPKMVNGMHPDLVDGKAVSNRFNRLDPESAKATPLTGNPHIDKKILKARKQPK